MPRRRSKPDRSKQAAMKRHASRRALERFDLPDWPRRKVIDAIKRGDRRYARFLLRRSNSISIWLIRWRDRSLPIVYNKRLGEIATVLPEEWLARNGFAADGRRPAGADGGAPEDTPHD